MSVRKFLFMFCLLLVTLSCQRDIHNVHLHVPKIFLTCIDDYLSGHSDYGSLTVVTDIEYNWRDGYKKGCVFLVGPSFAQINDNLSPSISFDYKKRKIFIQSSCDELFSIDNKNFYKRKCMKSKVGQSDIISFLQKAYVFEVNYDGKYRKVSNRADTLIMHKRVSFNAPVLIDN